MPDVLFGPLLSFTDVEAVVLDHYRKYISMWLAARERKMGITPGTISRPRSFITKQTFTALPGEEQTPVVIAVSDGFSAEPTRRGSGRYDALFRFGIAVLCMGGGEGQARWIAGHYQAALLGIALKYRSLNDGQVRLDDFINLRIEDVDEEAAGRSLAAVRMELVYRVNEFADDHEAPPFVASPADLQPQPDDVTVTTVQIDVEKESLVG